MLVACTVYSQDQIAEFEATPKVDENIPDAPEDIRPMFHRARAGGERLYFLSVEVGVYLLAGAVCSAVNEGSTCYGCSPPHACV